MKNFIEDSSDAIMLNSMFNVFVAEKLDPVGQEDDDIDNDGDSDKSDAYLKKRRKTVGAAIAAEKAKKVRKEEIELSLRQKVGELSEKKLYKSEKSTTSDEKEVTIEEKPVKNKITINPDIAEEASDAMKDRRMERGGVDGNDRYDRPTRRSEDDDKKRKGKTVLQKETEKKYGKGMSAMDIVKAQIRAKHGKGAIMDTKKEKDKKEED